MDKLFNRKILKYAKKYKSIQLLGGKCELCGEDRFFRLSFHHPDENKENTITELKTYKWDILEKEVLKCKLLCSNCHHELHYNDKITIYKESKKIYLEYKNINGCQECGYNKCNDCLTFHHINVNDKKMKLSTCRTSNINNIKENVIKELNKCNVICHNCHVELHSDLQFFNDNFNLIVQKSQNLKKMSRKIDRNLVKKMYFGDKMKQIDIVKYFDCSKSTISDIIKKLK